MRNRNDRGFSLVELIVVIAIMVVLTGLITIGAGMLNGKKAKQCRDELESKLQSVRVQTMGKRTVTATLAKKDGSYVLTVISTVNESATPTETDYTLGGGSACTIYYTCEDVEYSSGGSGLTEIDETGITITFDRASGAMKELTSDVWLRHIYVVQGSRVYGIKFYPETGKMELEDDLTT